MKIIDKYQLTKIKFINKLIHKFILKFNISMSFVYWISNETITYNNLNYSLIKNILEDKKLKFNFTEITLMISLIISSVTNEKINKLNDTSIDEYLKHYKNLFQLEKRRQDKLDNKIIQIITQSSIVITMISVIITQLQDKLKYDSITYILLFAILVSIILIALSIITSINETKPTVYLKPTPTFLGDESIDVKKKILSTYHGSIIVNTKVNDLKAKEIVKAYSYYKNGLILFIISLISLLIYSQYNVVNIQHIIKITNDLILLC